MKKCHVSELIDLMGKKWTFSLMQEISANGDKGFNFIFNRMGKISPKLLSQRLREMEELNLIEKKIISEKMPVRTTYRLTKKGKEFMELMYSVQKFGIKYGKSSENCGKKMCADCEFY